MDELKRITPTRWGNEAKQTPRRGLDEATAKKAGYPGALREEPGWHHGARVTKQG